MQKEPAFAPALAVPVWRLRRAMEAAGFSGGTRGLFSLYHERVHLGDLEVYPTEKGLELASLAVQDRVRGRGVGREMLRRLCAVADRLDVALRLTAVPIGSTGLDRKALAGFYGRAGFVAIRQDPNGLRMGRRPRPAPQPEPQPELDPVPEPF